MIRFFHVTLFFLYLCGKVCFSQAIFSNIKYQIETGTYLSTSNITPFWLRSNQYGTVPLQSPTFTFRGSAHKEYDSTKHENQKLKKFGIGYGFLAVANIGKQSGLLLPEAYFKVRYGAFEFYGGRRREIMGLVDTTLTSGSYIWSGNALPMPKIQLSIPNYRQVGKSSIFIKGAFAHGWFGSQGDIKNYYLHQKWLYGRIGKENATLKFYAGFNHNVQWGGYRPSINVHISNNWYGYLYSVFPVKRVATKAASSLTTGDLQNRVGNQLGSIDLGIELKKGTCSFFIYRQNLYEQGAALLRLANIKDGLNGLSITNTKSFKSIFIRKINLEFFYTLNQGTEPILFTKTVAWELENYFTHYQYVHGWTYKGQVMGTPMITTEKTTLNVFPETTSFVNNDRVKSFFLSVDLSINSNNSILIKNVYSENNGLRAYPVGKTLRQTSTSINYNINLKKQFQISSSLAIDRGEIYSNNTGLILKTTKQF